MATSSGNSGQVSSGDTAQLGHGELNNANNPAAAGALNEALGPIVHTSLLDALKAFGDVTSDFDNGTGDGTPQTAKTDDKKHKHTAEETTLNGGDVVMIADNEVRSVPLSDTPKPLQEALAGGGLNGLPSGH